MVRTRDSLGRFVVEGRTDGPALKRVSIRAWQEANPEKVAEYRVRSYSKRVVGVERRASRPRALACELCSAPEMRDQIGRRSIHFDHDHKTGEFRGWLCRRCNVTLGQVGDDPGLLLAMADYVTNGGPLGN